MKPPYKDKLLEIWAADELAYISASHLLKVSDYVNVTFLSTSSFEMQLATHVLMVFFSFYQIVTHCRQCWNKTHSTHIRLYFIEMKLEPRLFKNYLTMFESKLILKLPPFSLTYTVREKRRQFQNELTLKHSEVILELSWL